MGSGMLDDTPRMDTFYSAFAATTYRELKNDDRRVVVKFNIC